MFNLAGPEFDFGNVVFAVLAECEHRRRSLDEEDEPAQFQGIAREKLEQIRAAFVERGGSDAYWHVLQQEVLETALPRYARLAVEQNDIERSHYGLWRGGDILARAVFALIGITIGGIIIKLPFIPIFEDAFAFVLAAAGFLYPDIRRLTVDYRHSRELNRIVSSSQKYQQDLAQRYVSEAALEEALESDEIRMLSSARGAQIQRQGTAS